jgi:drug/metabolite transporter (DMT)-like permease
MRFPLLITSLHIAMKVPACRFCMWLFSVPTVRFGPRGWRVILFEVMPSGVATAADIGLSNLSYLYITVTYYTIVKSSVPLWIICFSACYGLLRVRPQLVGVVLCIIGGIVLTTFHEVEDDDSIGALAPLNASAAANATSLTAVAVDTMRRMRRQLRATAETQQPVLGGALVLGASLSAGFRWACTQLLLTRRDPPDAQQAEATPQPSGMRPTPYWLGLNPLTLLYYSSPFGTDSGTPNRRARTSSAASLTRAGAHLLRGRAAGALALLPVGIALETDVFLDYVRGMEAADILVVVMLALVGAVLAFCLLIFELRVVQLSSGLTLSIAGIFKEVLTVGFSTLLLGDHLTAYNVSGLFLCLVGIGLYNRMMLKRMKQEQQEGNGQPASFDHVQQVDR